MFLCFLAERFFIQMNKTHVISTAKWWSTIKLAWWLWLVHMQHRLSPGRCNLTLLLPVFFFMRVCLLTSNVNTVKKVNKIAPKISRHLKTIKTRTKCQSAAEGKVTSDRPCGCERSDGCELEGRGGDQWVSQWFGVGLWRQESPGYWSLQALARQLCLFDTDLWMKRTLQPWRPRPCSPCFISTRPAGKGMKTPRLTGVLFKASGKSARPST